MSKIVDFKALIQETLENRIFNIVSELNEDIKYKNHEKDEEALLKIIGENSPHMTGVIKELETIQLEKNTYELIHVYKRGLMEGAKFLKALDYLDLNFADEDN